MVIVKDQYPHLVYLCICINNKPVEIWAQLVINNARKKEKETPLLHRIMCFQMPEKDFMSEAFLRFKVLVEMLPLSLKLQNFKEGTVVSNNVS